MENEINESDPVHTATDQAAAEQSPAAQTGDGPLRVTWDDLQSRKVDARLNEQTAMARNRAYAQLDADAVPETSGPSKKNLMYNSIIYMAGFGILGGLLAFASWYCLRTDANGERDAADLIRQMREVTAARDTGRFTDAEAEDSLATLRDAGKSNPYFVIETNASLTADQRDAQISQLEDRDRSRTLIANTLMYGVCGLFIATCLAIADPLTQRNFPSAITNGSVAALLGLMGGLASAFFLYALQRTPAAKNLTPSTIDIISWSMLGLFIGAGAGVVMRNYKKLLIGISGGFIGGAIGGYLFIPIRNSTSLTDSNLIAFLAIGLITGLCTGVIENATRKAWLRVIAGVLAGKQFILYRNPTFIGSSPDCQIYLFKDNKVGPRHAAIHITPGGCELEDLPLGQRTIINSKVISRTRLRHGDRIQIGSTVFLYQDRSN